jgi:hypothetical protein
LIDDGLPTGKPIRVRRPDAGFEPWEFLRGLN